MKHLIPSGSHRAFALFGALALIPLASCSSDSKDPPPGMTATGGMMMTTPTATGGTMAPPGSGGMPAVPTPGCGSNSLKPGDPIKIKSTGDVAFDGMFNQTVAAGCLFGLPTDKTASMSYNDPTFTYQLVFNWNLGADSDYDGKSNDALVGKTLAFSDPRGLPSLIAGFSAKVDGKQVRFKGKAGAISIEELDATHVKGCLNAFSAWKTDDGKSVALTQPILFNCRH